MGEKASWDEARIGNPLWRNVFCEERITPAPYPQYPPRKAVHFSSGFL